MKVREFNKKELLDDLDKVKEMVLNDTFEGVLVYSHEDKGFLHFNKGWGEDRVEAIDAVFQSIYGEPNEKTRTFFIEEMYKRWKYYFGKRYGAEGFIG